MFQRNRIFLREIFLLSFISIGGPQVHITLFSERLVQKNKFLSENDLMELFAFCQLLPGPTSTQMITLIGYQRGRLPIALLTLFLWSFPAIFSMFLASIGFHFLQNKDILQFIQPVGIGFMIYSCYTLAQKIRGILNTLLVLTSIFIAYATQSPWSFPILTLVSGMVSISVSKEKWSQFSFPKGIKWYYLVIFLLPFLIFPIIGNIANNDYFISFERFYRNGSLVFGGGSVLIPVLYTELVVFRPLISREAFLTGVAFNQSLPGPVFSITTYLGSLIFHERGLAAQVLGAIIGTVGIFTPGTLLALFGYGIWKGVKKNSIMRVGLEGVKASGIGLMIASFFLFLTPVTVEIDSWITIFITFLVLNYTKFPSWSIFLFALLLGWVLN